MAEGSSQRLSTDPQGTVVADRVSPGAAEPNGHPGSPAAASRSSPRLRAARNAGYEGTRPEVRAMVPAQSARVLDLGCSSGVLGSSLKREQGVRTVVGVELDPVYADDARRRLDEVHCLDLNDLPGRRDLLTALGRFDCIVAADVLEHLVEPWAVLGAVAETLEPGGSVVVSLPNVRHWSVLRALLLRGSWPRADEGGIFDSTHLRWFTPRDAVDMIEAAGLSVETVRPLHWRRRLLRPLSPLLRALDATPLREFLAPQFLIRARAASTPIA
jgi:SAM-dependent methyltransferase